MKINFKIYGKILVLGLFALFLSNLSTPANNLALAQSENPCQPRQVCLDPESAEIDEDEEFTFSVGVGDVEEDDSDDPIVQADEPGIFGVEFTISFDPSIVEVVDDDPSEEGVQIDVGPLFSPSDTVAIGINSVTVEDGVGLIRFAATRVSPAEPFTIGGIAARFTVRGLSPGQSDLIFEGFNLSDKDGNPIEDYAPQDGVVIVGQETPTGQILLQGRTDHSGTDVILSDTACPSNTVVVNNILDPIAQTITDENGFFEFPEPVEAFQCLQAFRDNYLIAQKDSPSGDLGTITLRGGDATQDDKIDIFDLSFIGARYLTDDLEADVNEDGAVNIFDLTMAAGNFGTEGPLTDWQQ